MTILGSIVSPSKLIGEEVYKPYDLISNPETLSHYENISMQNTAIFHGSKNENLI